MFKLARILTRVGLNGRSPEHNPTVLDYLPRGGLVGYTSNNPQLAYLLLSEPAERFNFHVKDFSAIGENFTFDQKVLAAGATNKDHKFDGMYGRSNIDSGDVFDSNTVFVHDFPANVDEAKQLEERDGGVNLFMHIEFDEGVNNSWDDQTSTRVLECTSCGKIVKATPELIEEKTNGSELAKDSEIGEIANCNLSTSLCDWRDSTIDAKRSDTNENGEGEKLGDLHTYFDDRGLFVKFKVDSNMELNKARVELLRNIAGGFKL